MHHPYISKTQTYASTWGSLLSQSDAAKIRAAHARDELNPIRVLIPEGVTH